MPDQQLPQQAQTAPALAPPFDDERTPPPPAIILRAAGLSWADAFGQPLARLCGDGAHGRPDTRPLLDWIGSGAGERAAVAYAVVVVDVGARRRSALDVFARAEITEPLRLAFVLDRLRALFQDDGQVATLSSRRCVVVTPTSGTMRRRVAELTESLGDLAEVSVVDLPADALEARALVSRLAV